MPTAAEIQERLALYMAAEKAILEGAQEYSLEDGRRLRRADLAEIRKEIESLQHQLAIAQQGGRLSHSVTIFGGRRG